MLAAVLSLVAFLLWGELVAAGGIVQHSVAAHSTPVAILHIGPHKTSSSRVQGLLVNLTSGLASVNYYLPPYKYQSGTELFFDPKGVSKFATALMKKGDNYTAEFNFMGEFLKDSMRLNRNIILSAEKFSYLNQDMAAQLKEMLSGFRVLVVFVYRDVLSQIVSLHFESNRFEHARVQFSSSFSAHLLKHMDESHMSSPRPLKMLSTFSSVFGANNMRIIDLHGANAAKKEVTHVMLCQVAGVLCERNLSEIKVFSNPSYSLIPAQVFSHFKAHVVKQNDGKCRFCTDLFSEYEHFAHRYSIETSVHGPPANISAKLSLLLPYARQIDAQLREKFHGHVLESNQEENVKRMAQVRVQELDEDLFLEDVYWDKWIHSEYQSALTEGRLCNCTVV
eukprot:gene19191-21827_t